ncbi:MAG: helix-hairpin-helix domain-containing protein [Chloroflexota bacterium]
MISDDERAEKIARLRMLRNIGEKTAPLLFSLGIETPEHMLEADPEALYTELKRRRGGTLAPASRTSSGGEVRPPVADVQRPVLNPG